MSWERIRRGQKLDRLTLREKYVWCRGNGKLNIGEMASQLGVSMRVIERIEKSIKRKFAQYEEDMRGK